MSVDVSFHFAPEPVVVANALNKAAARLENLELPLLLSRNAVSESINRAFDTESAPDGIQWQELSESYAEKRGSEHPILTLTGALRDAATEISRMRVAGHTLVYDGDDLPSYGMAHQEGNRRRSRLEAETIAFIEQKTGRTPANDLPQRPFIGADLEAEGEIYGIFDAWVAESIDIGVFSKGPNVGRAFARDPLRKTFISTKNL